MFKVEELEELLCERLLHMLPPDLAWMSNINILTDDHNEWCDHNNLLKNYEEARRKIRIMNRRKVLIPIRFIILISIFVLIIIIITTNIGIKIT